MNRITTLGTSKVVALSVAVAVTLLALLPGAWSAAVAQTAGTPTATPSATETSTTVPAGASATVQAGETQTINIPAGAFDENVIITFVPIASDDPTIPLISELPTELVLTVFELSSLLPDGTEVDPDEPIEMTFEIDASTLALASGDLDRVSLNFFDEDTQAWISVECSGDAVAGTVTCLLPHFSIWALVILDEAPAEAIPAPADTGSGVFGAESGNSTNIAVLLIAIAGLAAVAGAGARFAVRRSRIE
jgi:hypothetical protein